MKIKTTQAVFVSSDEINALLTKFVEKKTNKKDKQKKARASDGMKRRRRKIEKIEKKKM
jgi:hypothetical protein